MTSGVQGYQKFNSKGKIFSHAGILKKEDESITPLCIGGVHFNYFWNFHVFSG
jgi:hypothetical protein